MISSFYEATEGSGIKTQRSETCGRVSPNSPILSLRNTRRTNEPSERERGRNNSTGCKNALERSNAPLRTDGRLWRSDVGGRRNSMYGSSDEFENRGSYDAMRHPENIHGVEEVKPLRRTSIISPLIASEEFTFTEHSIVPLVKKDVPLIKSKDVRKEYAKLRDKWTLYYHLPDDNRWDIGSYTVLMPGIDDPERLVSINEAIPDIVVKNAMLFVMRGTIQPMWEDSRNRKGGYLSFKVLNKCVHQIFKTMVYAVCGETLFQNAADNAYVNGLSISPKKTFCIVKVWLSDGKIRDSPFTPIPNLSTSAEEMKYTAFEAQIEADSKT